MPSVREEVSVDAFRCTLATKAFHNVNVVAGVEPSYGYYISLVGLQTHQTEVPPFSIYRCYNLVCHDKFIEIFKESVSRH